MTALEAADIGFDQVLDPNLVKKTLSAPPFCQVEGLLNVRRLPLTGATSNLILRSGETNHITSRGKEQLTALGVTKIFDLRSHRELERFQADPLQIPGVEIVHIPAFVIPRAEGLKDTFQRFSSGDEEGFLALYKEVLDEGGPAVRAVFEHIRDKVPNGEGCLFHCTGGKDRTGVMSMLILDLVGIPDEAIVEDYALTRVGLEPARPLLATRFVKLFEDPDLAKAALHGFSSRPSAMRATLKMLREEYGGAEGYLKSDIVGFSEGDISKFKEILA